MIHTGMTRQKIFFIAYMTSSSSIDTLNRHNGLREVFGEIYEPKGMSLDHLLASKTLRRRHKLRVQ